MNAKIYYDMKHSLTNDTSRIQNPGDCKILPPKSLNRSPWLVLLLIMVSALGAVGTAFADPTITLTGSNVSLEQGYPWKDPGFSAYSTKYGYITKDVKRTWKTYSGGAADSAHLMNPGLYVIYYDVTDLDGNKATTVTRNVTVTKDKTPPDLKVALPVTTTIEVTKTPIHPIPIPALISADDLVDGPMVGSVTIDSGKVQTNIVGLYKVTYTVSDISGNIASVDRYVNVIDTIKPVMKLIGNSTVFVQIYHGYDEQGVASTDNYYTSGVLNPLVQIISTVDTAVKGTYTVTYKLKDPSGNIADPVRRTVIVGDSLGIKVIDTTICKGGCAVFNAPVA